MVKIKRRTALFTLMAAILLLCSCSAGGRSDEDGFSQFRAQVADAAGITLLADVTADYGNRVSRYTLSYGETGGIGEIEVLAPELIAGVTASTSGGSGILSYDGVVLDTGASGKTGLTPIDALPAVIESIRSGHMETSWREDYNDSSVIAVDLTVSGESVQSLWLERETLTPIRSEIRANGRVAIICEFREWEIS